MRSRADTQATVATANSTNGNGMVYRLGVRKFEMNGSDDASDSGAKPHELASRHAEEHHGGAPEPFRESVATA